MILILLAYIGILTGFVFLVLSIASGLYYLSELVEEHTEPTKRFLTKVIYGDMVILFLLWAIDGLPFKLTMFSIVSYYVYLQNLKKFPYVQLLSPIFLGSCILVIANHFLWFNHFHNPYIPPLTERLRAGYVPPVIPSFVEVCSFFGLLIWFVPFALFVSLSAHDNLLPTFTESEEGEHRHKNNGLAKVLVGRLRDTIYNISRQLGYELDRSYGRII
ncbi:erv26 super protein [Scheffersomyces spartinae]|uniref:Erv26 super protein n=1 Tax=Scheffersomyces spartinae TaxID=45513 RepID=A0A9P8AK36_9ASCO|nr:erv26 super protein [Scheffersomyces spartinae]KAG7196065.1 erv26 super protein [Scheffersomyces spartinae]